MTYFAVACSFADEAAATTYGPFADAVSAQEWLNGCNFGPSDEGAVVTVASPTDCDMTPWGTDHSFGAEHGMVAVWADVDGEPAMVAMVARPDDYPSRLAADADDPFGEK